MKKTIISVLLVAMLLVSCGEAAPPDQTAIKEGMANFVLATDSISSTIADYMEWCEGNLIITKVSEGFPQCNKPIPMYLVNMFGKETAIKLVFVTCLAQFKGVAPKTVNREEILKRWSSTASYDPEIVTDKLPYIFSCIEALGGTLDNWKQTIEFPEKIETSTISRNVASEELRELGTEVYGYGLRANEIIEEMAKKGVHPDLLAIFRSAYVETYENVSALTGQTGGVSTKNIPVRLILYYFFKDAYFVIYGVELDEGLTILEQ